MVTGLVAASSLLAGEKQAVKPPNNYLELKTWRLHNTPEKQSDRLANYLEHGLAPALSNAGAKPAAAFSIAIGPDSPSYITVTQFSSLANMQEVLSKIGADQTHETELQKLSSGPGLPFVRVESSILRCFDVMPQVAAPLTPGPARRIFEMRTYESQSFATLARKVAMFNEGEAQIFERLGFRPVFFGETIVGPRQPNLTYMLSYDDLAARDRLWAAFISDPAWKKLIANPELQDPQIVANISNAILQPLSFSPIR